MYTIDQREAYTFPHYHPSSIPYRSLSPLFIMSLQHQHTTSQGFTLALCNLTSEKPFLPPEILRMILIASQYIPVSHKDELELLPEVSEIDCYRVDIPSLLPTDKIPDAGTCILFNAKNCFRRRLDTGGHVGPLLYNSAAQFGRLEMIQMLHDHGVVKSNDACAYAAEHGQVDCLRWLIEHNFPKSQLSCVRTAANGHTQCLQLLIANDFHKHHLSCITAIENGHVECLRLLIANGFPIGEISFLCIANLDCLKLLVDNGYTIPFDELDTIWARAKLEIVQWLLDCEYPRTINACAIGAVDGDLLRMQWLLDHDFPKSEHACAMVAFNGNMAMIQWLLDRDFPKSEHACAEAIRGHQTRCLAFLIHRNFPHATSYQHHVMS